MANPIPFIQRSMEWWHNNQEKVNAERMAQYYFEVPPNQVCEVCGINSATVRHHPNYSNPLHIQFLCAHCHRKKETHEEVKK